MSTTASTHLSPTRPQPASGSARRPLTRPATVAAVVTVLFLGAIFGFFYAWICSTMWGLDTLDPRTAIEAMNAMNASVRNAVLFPIFFLPPVVAGVAALLAWQERSRRAALLLVAAGVVYGLGGLALTGTVNVPMNEALLAAPVPTSLAEAEQVWTEYSSRWQIFNQIRTAFSGIALALAACAVLVLGASRRDADEAQG